MLQVFFHESSSPRHLKMALGSFRICSKFKMHHRYQRHRWQICRLCQLFTSGKCLTEGCAYEINVFECGLVPPLMLPTTTQQIVFGSQLCTALPQGYLQNCPGLRMPDPDVLLDKEKTKTSFSSAILWKISHKNISKQRRCM